MNQDSRKILTGTTKAILEKNPWLNKKRLIILSRKMFFEKK